MNPLQRMILVGGLLAVAAASLYPPYLWGEERLREPIPPSGERSEWPIDLNHRYRKQIEQLDQDALRLPIKLRALVFGDHRRKMDGGDVIIVRRLCWPDLLLEWAGIATITLALWVACAHRRLTSS